jgi:LysR family transcriptional regulator, glycine cleavage system transcriptional activator
VTTGVPLNAVLVFCAAARRGSFKLAAGDLNVTPGAVSRRIQALEAYVGEALFERRHRDVRLTRAGERLYERVAKQIESVEAEVALLRRGGRKTTVRVDSGVTFAMHWLIPRLASFHAANPGIEIQIRTSDGPVDRSARVDLHVRRDAREFRGLDAEPFLEEYSVLVASPALRRTAKAWEPRRAGLLQRIAAKSRPDLWPRWREFHGLALGGFEPTLELDNTVLAIQAAVEGLGAMVVPEMFVAGMLAGDALVRLESARIHTGTYYIVRRARRDAAAVRKFVDWVHAAGREAEGPRRP